MTQNPSQENVGKSQVLEPSMSKSRSFSFGFVFELFMENRTHPFYSQSIVNKLTHKEYKDIPYTKVPSSQDQVTLVHDIPSYLETSILTGQEKLNVKKIPQYQGYLVNLAPFKDLNAFLQTQLSKRNQKKLRSKERKLEESHAISYKFYYGAMDKVHYNYLFDVFYDLLEKRFDEKKMYNKNLIRWKYYHNLVYPLILEKKACLFAIYDGDKPITLSLNFVKEDTVFSFIQTYDINYSYFSMGDISMIKRLEWCKANNIEILDLSMGETDYKVKWCNHTYTLYHHVFYDPKSVPSSIIAFILMKKMNLLQYLRDKDIIGKWFQYDKFFYKSRKKKLQDYNWKASMVEN